MARFAVGVPLIHLVASVASAQNPHQDIQSVSDVSQLLVTLPEFCPASAGGENL